MSLTIFIKLFSDKKKYNTPYFRFDKERISMMAECKEIILLIGNILHNIDVLHGERIKNMPELLFRHLLRNMVFLK